MASKLMEIVRKICLSALRDSIRISSKSNQGDLLDLLRVTFLILELFSSLNLTIPFLRGGQELVEIFKIPYQLISSMEEAGGKEINLLLNL
jgi:hypothetical protein